MILQLANLTPEGSRFSGEEPVEVLAWPEGADEIIRPAGPMQWAFQAKLFGDELFVQGEASAPFSGICARCGRDMEWVVSEPLCFTVDVSGGLAEVDLTSELRDAILLALPNHPVCSSTCQGLCPRCGRPLVDGPCGCREESGGSPWEALDNLS